MAIEDAAALPEGMPRPGDTIDGKYSIVGVIGAGGMGVVYEAEHLRLKQRCAIKMLSPEMLREGDVVRRVEREARASALLKSAHVTRVTDVATTPDGVPYIVMELMTGQDLDATLSARGALPFGEAVDYVLQACAAVAEAHVAGIIHRDLKPGNLFLAQQDDGVLVKVLDFGISKMLLEEDSKLTSAGMTMGTALYMSPEQLRSAAAVDARSDIGSLGIILYELVCGTPPFVGSTTQIAAAIVSDDAPEITLRCPIPPDLAAAIHRTLRRKPDERFGDVAELAAALAPFAPVGSVGAKVAAQISRRSISNRQLPVAPSSAPGFPGLVDAEARTIARDVSTGVSHVVNNTASNVVASRRRRLALLAVVVAGASLVVVAALVLRRSPPLPAATASATTAASEPSAVVTPLAQVETQAVSSAEPAAATDAGATEERAAKPTTASPSQRPARPALTAAAPPTPKSTATPKATAAPTVVNPAFLP